MLGELLFVLATDAGLISDAILHSSLTKLIGGAQWEEPRLAVPHFFTIDFSDHRVGIQTIDYAFGIFN